MAKDRPDKSEKRSKFPPLFWLVILFEFFERGSYYVNDLAVGLKVRAGGSLLLAVLLHFGVHLDAMSRALPASATPVVIATATYLVFSLALFTLDRRAFAGRRPEAPGTPPALG